MSTEDDAARAIAVINMEECYRRRKVHGRDLNEWLMPLEDMGATEQRALLREIIGVTETLEQYDAREPQLYWHERLADLHSAAGDRWGEIAVLSRWLSCWPESRHRLDTARARVIDRVFESYAQVPVMATGRMAGS